MIYKNSDINKNIFNELYGKPLDNPPKEIILNKVKLDGSLIRFYILCDAIDDEIKKEAISNAPFSIQYIPNPSKELMWLAFEKDQSTIIFIKHPPKDMISRILREASDDNMNTVCRCAMHFDEKDAFYFVDNLINDGNIDDYSVTTVMKFLFHNLNDEFKTYVKLKFGDRYQRR